ncbi:MAG: DUF4440 domain-containing protein [Pirellulales bacterium]|nr:DUF4440 domain-containing protein [Pirellulales bacterium]
MDELQATLRILEERLLHPEVRRDPEAVALLLADDFRECGASGRIYDKSQVLAVLQGEQARGPIAMRDFQVRALAPGVALATYRAWQSLPGGQHARGTWRSSLWRQEAGAWRLVFHQGTELAEGPGDPA